MWQIAHPPQRLIDAFAEEPEVPPDWNLDFASALTQLLTATCVGLLIEPAQQNPPDKPMRSTARTSWRHGRSWPSCHRRRTAPLFRCGDGLSAGAIPARPALLIHVPTARRCSLATHPSTELHRPREPRACPVAKRHNAKSITAGHSGKSPSPEPCAAHRLLSRVIVTSGTLPKPRSDPVGLQ